MEETHLIAEKIMSSKPLTKFQRIVNRLMTEDELRGLAAEMNISRPTTEWIVEQFETAMDALGGGEYDLTEEDVARDNGRLGLYMSWQDVLDDLSVQMTDEEYADLPEDQQAQVTEVFDAFFDE